MTKMLLKDFAAVLCGILCAIICFSILVHYQFFDPGERAFEERQTMNIERALKRP